MEALISFFEGIANAVSAAFEFLISIVQDIVYLVQLTGRMLVQIPMMMSWIPSPVLAILTTGITIAVLFKVLGRE